MHTRRRLAAGGLGCVGRLAEEGPHRASRRGILSEVARQSSFSELSFNVALAREPGNRAFFGQDVLRGLIDGVDDFVHERQSRWKRRTYRIGARRFCSPWVSDRALLDKIEKLPGACVVISKTPRRSDEERTFSRLRVLNERTSGIELRVLSTLSDLAPKAQGQPRMLEPYDRTDAGFSLSTIRTAGHRKTGGALPPIAHAKLALLGGVAGPRLSVRCAGPGACACRVRRRGDAARGGRVVPGPVAMRPSCTTRSSKTMTGSAVRQRYRIRVQPLLAVPHRTLGRRTWLVRP